MMPRDPLGTVARLRCPPEILPGTGLILRSTRLYSTACVGSFPSLLREVYAASTSLLGM